MYQLTPVSALCSCVRDRTCTQQVALSAEVCQASRTCLSMASMLYVLSEIGRQP